MAASQEKRNLLVICLLRLFSLKAPPADVIFMCSLEKDGEELDGYNVDVSLIYYF